tara:strand:- start:2554 stop:3168 length:615 start_codon:yes stop_codon:yes gene_type:complete
MSAAPDADAFVAELESRWAAEGGRPEGPGRWTENRTPANGISLAGMGARPPAKMRYTHEAMADLIISEPAISQNTLAATFGFTPGWVSTVINSDAFQALLATRREEIINPELIVTVRERFQAVTAQSLRILQDKLARPADQVSDQLALRAAELGAKALGLGGNAAPPPPPNPAEYLPQLAERLMRLTGQAPAQVVSDAVVVGEG